LTFYKQIITTGKNSRIIPNAGIMRTIAGNFFGPAYSNYHILLMRTKTFTMKRSANYSLKEFFAFLGVLLLTALLK